MVESLVKRKKKISEAMNPNKSVSVEELSTKSGGMIKMEKA